MQLLIFGAGNTGKKLYYSIKERMADVHDAVVAFSDNNHRFWNTGIDGIEVIKPERILSFQIDLIIVCSVYFEDIKKQLLGYGIREDCIKNYDQFSRYFYARERYFEKYGSIDVIKSNKPEHAKVIVYTAITGNHDMLNEPLFCSDHIEYVCFTDNNSLRSDIWKIEKIRGGSEDSVMASKKYKLHPELYFREYDISVWIDGKYLIKDNLKEYIDLYFRNGPMLCFPHPSRKCVFDEAACCIYNKIGKKRDILSQMVKYYNNRYPIDSGLYEMGCIVREHNDDRVLSLMEAWEKEIRSTSYRDQISFPYVCKQQSFYPDICDLDINDNKYIYMNRKM